MTNLFIRILWIEKYEPPVHPNDSYAVDRETMVKQFIHTVLIEKYVWPISSSGDICTALIGKHNQIVTTECADREIGYDQQFICISLIGEYDQLVHQYCAYRAI